MLILTVYIDNLHPLVASFYSQSSKHLVLFLELEPGSKVQVDMALVYYLCFCSQQNIIVVHVEQVNFLTQC